ncbi:MAG: hypothetical protein QG671_1780 [Actinomycetota bacterium]|jgi:hypothetical protein|nr:hypothetical protein [Bacteroidales bacterium]MDQ1305948.1 hypothetical protein [Actinomycetota bacterium]
MAPATWPAAYAAILSALRAALDVPVLDADDDLGAGGDLRAAVVLGTDTGDEGRCGVFAQEYHDLGATATRDDIGTIDAQVFAQSGGDDLAPLRAAAFDALADVESALRSGITLGVASALRIELSGGDVFQGRTEDGTFVEVRFQLTYTALI